MSQRKRRANKAAFPDREIIAKADGRFAKADKQRANIRADPQNAVSREKRRITRRKPEKPDA